MADGSASGALQQLQVENQRLKQEIAALQERLKHATMMQTSSMLVQPPRAATALQAPYQAGTQPAGLHSSASSANGVDGSSTAQRSSEQYDPDTAPACPMPALRLPSMGSHGLSKAQVERYSRQLLLPCFGPAAQERLCAASALIVGCGGLGAPAALYLAAAGIGTLGLADRDTVELSNLHRQVIHAECRVGQHKAASAAASCAALNSAVRLRVHSQGLSPANAVELVGSYDVVLDCSDNAPTRYLLSDACAACDVPLVSAAALGTDGQLTVYCHGDDGPCYRCLFPTPPAAQHCGRCSEAGVLGPVPGVMGVLQALEAMKVVAGIGEPLSRKLLLFDGLSGRFNTVRLRARVEGCVACASRTATGAGGGISRCPAGSIICSSKEATAATKAPSAAAAASMPEAGATSVGAAWTTAPAAPVVSKEVIASYDYAAFTGQAAHDGPDEDLQLLPPEQRVTAKELARAIGWAQGHASHRLADADDFTATNAATHPAGAAEAGSADASTAAQLAPLLLDVRPTTQYSIMALPGAYHVPIEQLEARLPEVLKHLQQQQQQQQQRDKLEDVSRKHAKPQASGKPQEKGSASSDSNAAGGSNLQAGGDANTVKDSGSSSSGVDCSAMQQPPVYVICRRGNDSQLAVQLLREAGVQTAVDVIGGYQSWAIQVDGTMPLL